ncbi:hypothetical protein EJ02DRAFT_486580 [Clathrospora elynae]|uniref:Uncharacterized protein n=1 Tax=Clathrospora elynae TaxID=706981 RepID=A0A6A5SXD1_9PLEO|nr:hypothetical protein EJ02DRAFT_486580 [Clathrospora elynae]
MYPDRNTGADAANKIEISLNDILEPTVKISHPEKKRYTYASAEPTKDKCCGVCGHQFDKNNKKSRPDRMNEHLLQCARKQLLRDARRHMTDQFNYIHRCAWNDCNYCFEHNGWCQSDQHAFDLHTHMKKHLAQLDAPPSVCPHPHCQSMLGSEDMFWSHAEDVHGMLPFGPCQLTGKRKTQEELEDLEEGTDDMADTLKKVTVPTVRMVPDRDDILVNLAYK